MLLATPTATGSFAESETIGTTCSYDGLVPTGSEARAWRELYEQHGPMVYRRALRILGNPEDARDATQEVFIRVIRGSDGFESRSSVTTWLYRITTNYCLNLLRDRQRRRELLEEHVVPGAREQATRHPTQVNMLLLRRLLSRADERQAAAAVCVLADGMSHDEAAEVLQVSRRTIGNLIERFQAWAQEQTAENSNSEPPPKEVRHE